MPPGWSRAGERERPRRLSVLGGKVPWPSVPAPHPRQTRFGRGTETGTTRLFLGAFRSNTISYGKCRRGSPRLVDSPQESGPIGFADVRQCSGMNPKTGKKKRGNPVSPFLSPGRR